MIPKYPDFLRNPGSSFEFVTWLRKFLDDDFDTTATLKGSPVPHELLVEINGLGVEITTGIKADVKFDFPCQILGWTLLADQSGSIVMDIWKDTFANYPPTIANTITGGAQPTLSSQDSATTNVLTGWTTAIQAGDTLRFNVDSVSTITRVTLALSIKG